MARSALIDVAMERFQLVGARFSKILIDENSAEADPAQELTIQIGRSGPAISKHMYGERKVIEIRVHVSGVSGTKARLKKGAVPTATDVFTIELTAGFVGSTRDSDGDMEAFREVAEQYYRSAYWMLRERIDSVFAVTVLRGAHLPWDILSRGSDSPSEENASTKRRSTRAKK